MRLPIPLPTLARRLLLSAAAGCMVLTVPTAAHDVRFAGPSPGDLRGATVSRDAKGRILVYSGQPRFWNAETRSWQNPVGSSPEVRRFEHSMTTLVDGRVVVIGGVDLPSDQARQQNALASVSAWDADAATWTAGPSLITPRLAHTATALPGGEALVTGGSSTMQGGRAFGAFLRSVELVDANVTMERAALWTARAYHSASLLADGRVLVAGGLADDGRTLGSTEIYDPRTDRWEAGPNLLMPRSAHTATVLRDGSVLLVGGFDAAGKAIAYNEILAPGANEWRAAGVLAAPRGQHEATLLSNGDVLVSGGLRALAIEHSGSPVLSLELRRAEDGEWTAAGELPLTLREHHALLTDDDVVLLFGADPYGSATLAWVPDAPEAITPAVTNDAPVVPLGDGRFMVVGGNRRQDASAAALIYDSRDDRWTSTSPLHWPRTGHRAVRLRDGRVLVLGGTIHGVATSDPRTHENLPFPAEIWNPRTGHWSLSSSLEYASGSWQEPALLGDGRVMLSGINNTNSYSDVLQYFRVWDPDTDAVTATTEVPRNRRGGFALYYADGHLLHLGGEDESSRDGKRLDSWDPVTKAWKELRPAELSLNGMRLRPLEDGGVLAWSPPASNGAARVMLAWQPHEGWRSLPLPETRDADPAFEAHSLENGELLLATGDASWLWRDDAWQPIAHESSWGFVLGVFSRDGKTIAFRTRDRGTPSPFGALEAVTLNPLARRWELPAARYISRELPALAALGDGRVLVSGGGLAQTQLFDSGSGAWRASGHTHSILRSATSLLLRDGSVLIAGIDAQTESRLICEQWQPAGEQWQPCGDFPADSRRSDRAPVLRYLDETQVLLVHGEDHALVRTAAGRWVATKLQLPRDGVPAINSEGKPFLDNPASVWNPARKRWDDATDVLFRFRQGWAALRTADGDVIGSSGYSSDSLLEWRARARTLSRPRLAGSIEAQGFDGLARTADGCVLSWTNSVQLRDVRVPILQIAHEDKQAWIATDLAYEVPRLASAIDLPGGELLLAGESWYSRDAVVRLKANCADVRPVGEPMPAYLPIAKTTAKARAVKETSTRIEPAPLPSPSLAEAWLGTWRAHLANSLELIKSKLLLGVLLVFFAVRVCRNRWGAYPDDAEFLASARRMDIALVIASTGVALVALGIPWMALQWPVATAAATLAAFSATRLYSNALDSSEKRSGILALLVAWPLAVAIVGTYAATALRGALQSLTD